MKPRIYHCENIVSMYLGGVTTGTKVRVQKNKRQLLRECFLWLGKWSPSNWQNIMWKILIRTSYGQVKTGYTQRWLHLRYSLALYVYMSAATSLLHNDQCIFWMYTFICIACNFDIYTHLYTFVQQWMSVIFSTEQKAWSFVLFACTGTDEQGLEGSVVKMGYYWLECRSYLLDAWV